MAPRVLVCIEDTGVAHVVAARLMKDGVDGVVVDKPGRLVDEARKGVAALAVQDRYPSGEAATSLLRQIRVARAGDAAPAIVLLTGELPQGDKLVLEKQYKVKEFIRIAENPIRIAQAVATAAGHEDQDIVLHPDEEKNAFDISVESVSNLPPEMMQKDDDFILDDGEPKTVEVSAQELKRLRMQKGPPAPLKTVNDDAPGNRNAPAGNSGKNGAAPANGAPSPHDGANGKAPASPLTQEAETTFGGGDDAPNTSEGLLDLSRLPAPGGEADVEFLNAQPTSVQSRPASPSPISVLAPPDAGAAKAAPVQGDSVQATSTIDQKAQNELKKALIAERKQREAAQKRVEELEQQLAKVGAGDVKKIAGGVPTEGVFEDIRYPALLARCRADAFTGAIVMQSGGATRNVYLKDGLPVAFHSSEPGERIGKVLVTQGRITDAQYMQATTRSVERSIKLTDALVELGWMDAETIAVEQRNLARDQIIQSFELVQGRFTVSAGTAPDANTATFDFGPGEIYVQGYRRYAPTSEMMAAYESLRDKYLIANARLASYRPKLGLTGEDERLLRLLGEALTVEEAVERATVGPEAAARLLSALQALELVEEWSPGVEQFRSRIRMEKQRHAEEINNVMQEARGRESRMLEAFEKALSKLGAGSLSSHMDHGSDMSSMPSPQRSTAPSFGGSPIGAPSSMSSSSMSSISSPSSAMPSSLTRSPTASPTPGPNFGSSPPATAGSSGSTSPSPRGPVSSVSVGSSSSPPAAVSSSFIHSASAANSVTVSAPPSSPPPQEAPTISVAPSNGAAAKLRESAPLSVADLKYKEGVEQAAQNRLDEAEVTLREAVRLDASKPEYLTSLARVLLANPRYERAGTLPVVRSLLDRAVQIAPDFQEAADLHAQVIKEMSG